MKLRNLLKRKRSMYEKELTPKSLNADPVLQESKLAAVIAVPFLAFLFAMIFLANNYAFSKDEFMVYLICGMIVWFIGLIGFTGHLKGLASEYKLFDREFGFDERLHPRREIYCKPEDIRLLLKPTDKIEDFEELKTKIKQLGFDEGTEKLVIEKLQGQKEDGKTQPPKKFLYYFRHKDICEGWNAQEQVRLDYKSHMVFTDELFDDQFVFSAGQENWFGPITYNHSSAESDNVRVLGWTLDPFSHEPMPICELIHSSKRYMLPEKKENDFKLLDAQNRVIAMIYGLNQSFRRQIEHVTELKDANFAGQKNIIDLAHDASKADIDLYEIAMKPTARKWMSAKGILVTIVSIVAVTFIIVYVLNWLQYIHVW